MKSKFTDKDAKLYISKFAKKGVPKDLALRIYTTQLLGNDPTVVLHGGGNTSVKSSIKTLLGKVEKVILPRLNYDIGDIELLSQFFPNSPSDGFNGDFMFCNLTKTEIGMIYDGIDISYLDGYVE